MAQAYVTDAELLALFPELSPAASVTVRQHYLDLTKTMISLTTWEDKASLAHLHLAAHYIAAHPGVSVAGAGAGVVASKSIGGLAVSYAVAAPSDAGDSFLESTKYGRVYLQLRDSILGTPLAVGME